MNLLLFHHHEEVAPQHWQLPADDRRIQHLRTVLNTQEGDSVEAGVLQGRMGRATLLTQDEQYWHFQFQPKNAPPMPLPTTLIVALPRPKMLRRVLIDAISLGIKHIILLNSYKVEKSYWHTPRLAETALKEISYLALEQAKDTQLPLIELKKRFKPFIEDELPQLMTNKEGYVLHPGEAPLLPFSNDEPHIIAVGPEGGWTEYEISRFVGQGFIPCGLGQRILRVETAIPTIIGRIAPLP